MFLENVPGLADRILRNFDVSPRDSALVVSSSGSNVVSVEMAEGFRRRGLKVVAIVSRAHAEASKTRHPRGLRLTDCADLVLDTGAPGGDAAVRVPGLDTPVARLHWRLPARQRADQGRGGGAPHRGRATRRGS
jgi:uncharacterized phosphosugar-binding protein